ncbi:MAG TPA: DUF4416 family protein [Spirochaetota bacterium]|nr:DUF4416 family protein [Spirochaetota bacterium]HSA15733.1 DUF4416 family protein [Spirochaetota bacterium]
MAEPVIPPKAKLIAGLLCGRESLAGSAIAGLEARFGPVDLESAAMKFEHSDYYRDMGDDLKRSFISFERLIERDAIAGIKIFTNGLESSLSEGEHRLINIDPGYLTLSNLFLASCKEYYHRAYLSAGVYLENEYRYTGGRFVPWDWTYPDYRTPESLEFFHRVREKYHGQIRAGG